MYMRNRFNEAENTLLFDGNASDLSKYKVSF